MSVKKKCCLLVLLSVFDITASTLLFIHGTKWKLFMLSIYHYSFQHSFIDLWFWMVLRTCVFIGGFIGVLHNLSEGPARLKKYSWIFYFLACANAYFACAKLLVFSEQPEFVAGHALTWFWFFFGWSLVGIVLYVYQLSSLGSLKSEINDESSSTAIPDSESQPLLAGTSNGYATINETQPNSTPHVTFAPNVKTSSKTSVTENSAKSDRQKKKKEDEEKSMTELVNKATMKKMFSFVLPDWPIMTLGLLFLIGASVAEIFLPLYTGKVITGIVVKGDRSQFTRNLIEMAGISLLASVCAGMRAGCFMTSIQRLNIRVRNALFASITSQEIGFFDEMRTGDMTSRLTSDTTTMSDTVGLNLNIFLRSVIKAIGVCVFMFALSWRLSIVTFAGLPLVFTVSKFYGSYYKKLQKLVQDRFALANEVAEEVCSSMQTVRSFANEEGEKRRYADRLDDVYKIQRKQAISYSGYIWSNEIFGLLLIVGVLWYAGHLILNHLMPSDSIVSFVLYQFDMADILNSLGSVYTGLMQALGAAEKVFELIERKPKISTDDGTKEPPVVHGHIKFENVTFAYPTRKKQTILQNVSFEVKPGEVVALVGPSGGGKSSCVKLLQRFYDPTAGRVLIDGLPVSSYKHEFLHEKVSLVGQEPVLYARSVAENISYGMDTSRFTHDDIKRAAIAANAHMFISELCDGYETETGEKGTQLSGGQKQRVAIARALIRNPRILLLDEATSALDTESEYLVQEALERSKSHRTVVLIAHRLSTVERADRIVVIVKGEVAEQGSHLELMEKQGVYYSLVYRQLHGAQDTSIADNTLVPSDTDIFPALTPCLPMTPEVKMLRRRSTSGELSTSFGSTTSVASMQMHL